MFRICSDFSAMFSNVQTLFRLLSNVQNLFRLLSNVRLCGVKSRNCLHFANTRYFSGVCVAHRFSCLCCHIMCLSVLSSVWSCLLRLSHNNYVWIALGPVCFWRLMSYSVFSVCMFAHRDALCLMYLLLSVYLDYPFFIDPLGFFFIDSLLLLLFVFTRNSIICVSLAFGVFNNHWLYNTCLTELLLLLLLLINII